MRIASWIAVVVLTAVSASTAIAQQKRITTAASAVHPYLSTTADYCAATAAKGNAMRRAQALARKTCPTGYTIIGQPKTTVHWVEFQWGLTYAHYLAFASHTMVIRCDQSGLFPIVSDIPPLDELGWLVRQALDEDYASLMTVTDADSLAEHVDDSSAGTARAGKRGARVRALRMADGSVDVDYSPFWDAYRAGRITEVIVPPREAFLVFD